MYDLAQLDARGFYQELKHPITGSTAIRDGPFASRRGPSATIGSRRRRWDSTTTRCCDGLGLTDDEIEELRARNVIGERALNA